MHKPRVISNHIDTRNKVEALLNKGLPLIDISLKLGIRIGHVRDKGSIKWYRKCISSKINMHKIHREQPEVFINQRLNLDEENIKELYQTKEIPPYKIAKIMKCDTVTIFNRLKGMNVRIRSYSESHKLNTYASLKRIKNTGLTSEKAYILGTLCGDGWISSNLRIGLGCIDKDFVQEFQRNIELAYGVYCDIKRVRPKNPKWSMQYKLNFCSRLACDDISSYGNFSSGKWMVFVYTKELDEVWERISKATEKGLLGGSSKCATLKPNPNSTNPDTKVICVYTYDSEDKDDVARIAWELYQLGAAPPVLNYKEDKATLEGKYKIRGDKRVSKYSIHISHFGNKTKEEFLNFFKEKYS